MTFDRRITPARPDLADERLRGSVEAERFATGTPMRVVAASAPLRRFPSPDASLDTEALMGERVTIFDEHEGFAWGQLAADGYVGFLPSDALGAPGAEPTHRVSSLRTFLYPGPSLKLPPSTHLSLGAQVAATGAEGGYVRLATGGFVHAAHLVPIDAFEPDFVAVAERLVGTPYLWGGKSSLGLDCSGLVQLSLAVAGLAAPRDSDMQERELGETVAVAADLSGLRRGDLVCWKGHIGVMLDEGRLLHANGHHMAVGDRAAARCRRAHPREQLRADHRGQAPACAWRFLSDGVDQAELRPGLAAAERDMGPACLALALGDPVVHLLRQARACSMLAEAIQRDTWGVAMSMSTASTPISTPWSNSSPRPGNRRRRPSVRWM
jgi:cell wall-associated NlpC family hydrolase